MTKSTSDKIRTIYVRCENGTSITTLNKFLVHDYPSLKSCRKAAETAAYGWIHKWHGANQKRILIEESPERWSPK